MEYRLTAATPGPHSPKANTHTEGLGAFPASHRDTNHTMQAVAANRAFAMNPAATNCQKNACSMILHTMNTGAL